MAPDSVPSTERHSAPGSAASAALSPEDYSAFFLMDLEAFDGGRDRSKQSDAGVIGVSDLHTCREKVRRTLLGMVATDVPEKWAAIVGTYVDEGVKAARAAARPWLLHDVDLKVKLPNGLIVPGHADEIDTQEPSCTDLKTKSGLSLTRREGADEHDRAQRHLYYLGAHQAGLVPAEGIVRNVFLDRSGGDAHPHVEQEPFSMDVVLAAQSWYEDAIYAAKHGEDAMKDWPRNMCQSYCQFFTACRGGEPIIEEQISGHRAVVLAAYVDAKERKTEAQAVYDEARAELKGITGRSDTHWVRSTVMNSKTGAVRVDADKIEGVA